MGSEHGGRMDWRREWRLARDAAAMAEKLMFDAEAERDNLLAAERELRQQLAETKAELRRWRGCPACLEDHPENTICPPYEVRVTGQAWRTRQTRQWEEVARIAEDLARRNADRAEKAERDADMWHQSYQQDAELRSIDRRRAEKAERERDEANELRTQEAHMLAKAIIRVERAEAAAGVMREALEPFGGVIGGPPCSDATIIPMEVTAGAIRAARAALASGAGEKAAAVLSTSRAVHRLLEAEKADVMILSETAEMATAWQAWQDAVAGMEKGEADHG